MLRRFLAVTAAAAIALTGFVSAPPAPAAAADDVLLPNAQVVPVEHVDLVDAVFHAINDYRENHGLLPLAFSPDMFEIAQSWSDQMVATDIFQHRHEHWKLYPAGSSGSPEIIAARMDASAQGLVNQWINSDPHRAILLEEEISVMGPGVALDNADTARYFMYGTTSFGAYDEGEIATYPSIRDWIAAGGETDREDVVAGLHTIEGTSDGRVVVEGWALDFSRRDLATTATATLDGQRSVTAVADRAIWPWGAGEWRQGRDFQASFVGVKPGNHSVCIVANNRYGAGAERSLGCQNVFVPFPVDRLAGANRYDTAVEISARYNDPAEVDTVYLATGAKYPDALSLAPAAAQAGNALLLTPQGQLWPSVEEELQRLAPTDVVIVGAEDSVSARAAQQVAAALPSASIERLAGENRYETSALIAQRAFDAPTTAYVASGQLFPDALSAAPIAAASSAPVLLTPGAGLPESMLDYLAGADLANVIIAGGTPSVSERVESQLAELVDAVPQRIAGADRYETNRLLAATAASGPQTEVLLASGSDFPDALAGAAIADGAGPLLLSRSTCVSTETVDLIVGEYLPERVVVLGGTPTLSASAAELTRCG